MCLEFQARAILDQVTLKKILLYIASEDETISTSMTHVLQNIINSISNLDNIKKDREKHEAARKADPAARIRPFPFVFEKIGEDMRDEIIEQSIFLYISCRFRPFCLVVTSAVIIMSVL